MASAAGAPALVHHLFEQQVDRRPEACAVVCGPRSLTYAEVEQQANRLARLLRARGAARGRFVAVYLERSERAIVAILAVLKSGAAYVPIDPVYPPDRIRHIVEDAAVCCLVSEGELAEAARRVPLSASVLDLSAAETDRLVAMESAVRIDAALAGVEPSDLCYVMYTSGTTGRPKGIMTEHRNVVAFTAAFQDVCRIREADRVYQGFSLGFDGSVEEYVLAFAGGAPLVVGPSALARDGRETARYLVEHDVTYFSTVPTFLRLVVEDIPSLRLIVLSGEPCPPDLVRTWLRAGRTLLNVYGPTEATVNTTSWECRTDSAVSIGRALAGYYTYILDANGQSVASGPGELFVGGAGVSRGYLNQPELTARAFVPDPFAGATDARMYRTGDLVEADAAGDLRFLGRLDSQVKVRGFRIELAEIESVLQEFDGVVAAASTVFERDGQTQLAAYLVTGADIDRGQLLAHLRRRLPPYMVPAFVDEVADMPRLSSGKLDRRSLPEPQRRLVEAGRRIVAPRSPIEARLAALWERLLRTSPISVEDDFFLDLGGDSLLATSLVNSLHTSEHVAVALRDVYAHPTIAGLAGVLSARALSRPALENDAPRATSHEVFAATPAWERAAALGLQAIGAVGLYGLAAVIPLVVWMVVHSVIDGSRSIAAGLGILLAVATAGFPLWIALTIALKWIIVGRYKEGRHSAYGLRHVRYWLARRIQTMSGAGMLCGTPLMSAFYRLMGARIGRGCIIDTPTCAAFDLVAIGDDTCIGAETHLLGYRLADGMIEFGRIDIGRRCFVGIHSALGIATRMHDDSRLGDLSLLPEGETIPAGESWRGAPAAPGPVLGPADADEPVRAPSGMSLLYFALVLILEAAVPMALAPGAAIVWALRERPLMVLIAALVAAVPITVLSLCMWLAVLKAIVLRRTRPGTYPVNSAIVVRKWFVDSLVRLSRIYLHPLYTTIYLPPWLRLLGARVGRFAEISTISQGAPDLFDIGDQSFFADGSMLGGRRFCRGRLQVDVSRIGRRSFIGNSAIVPVGVQVGDGCLVGVLSTPPLQQATTPDHTEWLGSPPFRLPHRRQVEGFDSTVTFEPTRRLFAHRLFVDAMRILLPGFIGLAAGVAGLELVVIADSTLSLTATWLLLPVAACALAAFVVLIVAGLKAAVMGRFEPIIKPLWCSYVWWNEVVNGAWETLAAPALGPLVGSPLFNVALRLMGCHVGSGARVHTTLFSEFDLVRIGRFSVLGEGAVIQNHLFEDRIMKSSVVTIGSDVSVGNMAVVLYDAVLEAGAAIAPLSLVMKGAVVPPGARWIGIPASPFPGESARTSP